MQNDSTPNMVYLVWEGEYSDATVIAAFSTESAAIAYAALRNGHTYRQYADARVEPLPLDDPEQCNAIRDLKPRWQYSTWGWNRDTFHRVVEPTLAPEQPPTHRKSTNKYASGYDLDYWEGVITADSADDAVKIASDLYAKVRAELSGIA